MQQKTFHNTVPTNTNPFYQLGYEISSNLILYKMNENI